MVTDQSMSGLRAMVVHILTRVQRMAMLPAFIPLPWALQIKMVGKLTTTRTVPENLLSRSVTILRHFPVLTIIGTHMPKWLVCSNLLGVACVVNGSLVLCVCEQQLPTFSSWLISPASLFVVVLLL